MAQNVSLFHGHVRAVIGDPYEGAGFFNTLYRWWELLLLFSSTGYDPTTHDMTLSRLLSLQSHIHSYLNGSVWDEAASFDATGGHCKKFYF